MTYTGAQSQSRGSLDVVATLGRVPFRDQEAARQLLTNIAARVSPGLAIALGPLLADVPDPDFALVLFDRLICEAGQETAVLLEKHPLLAHYALAVFGHSRYLGETLIQNSDLLPGLLRDRNLDRSFSQETFQEALARFRTRSWEGDLSTRLAAFKRREYVRIMLRDVLKLAPLAETTAEISALSDVLIDSALREASRQLQTKFGTPQHLDSEGRLQETTFSVLSLGKLGGNELNYSSDIDLLFIYGDGQEPASAAISNKEYFIRLAQLVTEILSRVTPQGSVFRIDLRLRPEGTQGELAVSLTYALQYYEHTAHDWERQALIKVRHSAGDAKLARRFIRGIQPYVYTENINFAAIKTALVSREKIQHRALSKPASTVDVKLDSGGIRDVEFLVQCLQRVYGGKEPWLRSGGTLFSLQKLYDKDHISGHEFHELNAAYVLLRHVEHRLQLRFGQQTHKLPSDVHELAVVTRSMTDLVQGKSGSLDLTAEISARMAEVSAIYKRIVFQQQTFTRTHPEQEFRLRSAAEIGGSESNQQLLDRLEADMPGIGEMANWPQLSSHARRNLSRFLTAAFTSSGRYAAVRNHPEALARALVLLDLSEYLSDILVRHPEEITSLADLRDTTLREGGGYLFGGPFGRGAASADPVFEYIAHSASPYAEKLVLLRQHFRRRLFTSGARDVTELREVYRSLAVTTSAIEDAIAAAWTIAGQPPGVAVFALGRLGTGEFDVLSDADLLFVAEEHVDRTHATRALERFIHVLAAYTRDGMVCAVDTRLRPHGGEGELLTTPTQLEGYFAREAKPWEALMYTKLRLIAGSAAIAERTHAATCGLLRRFAADPDFGNSVHEMRRRLEPGEKNIKLSPGGTYDIDFVLSYLLIRNQAHETGGTLRDRIWRCVAAGLLDKKDGAELDHAAELTRTVDHVVRLVVGRPLKWLPTTEHARATVEDLAAGILKRPAVTEPELESALAQVRSVYKRVLATPE